MTAASCRKSSGYCYLLIGEGLGLGDDTTLDRRYVTHSCFVASAQRRVRLWATLYLLSTWLTAFLLEWNADSGLDPLLLSPPPPRQQITSFVSPFDFNWLFSWQRLLRSEGKKKKEQFSSDFNDTQQTECSNQRSLLVWLQQEGNETKLW